MKTYEAVTDVVANGGSRAEWEKWGPDFTVQEPVSPVQPVEEALSASVQAFDARLHTILAAQPLGAYVELGNR